VAIGAARGDFRIIVHSGFPVASGIPLGLVAALALSPVLEALLFGVTACDPVT
jgi:hypothetical protein